MHDVRAPYVFVHGLCGWGGYSPLNHVVPCWGLLGKPLLPRLRAMGFDCVAATTGAYESAWDRACELYAQLTGTRTDYGASHSARMGHRRFGRDYSRRPLLPGRDLGQGVHLVCHSFGGTAARLLVHLLCHGDEAERAATSPDGISPLFCGGNGGMVLSVTAMATPHCGTTVYQADYRSLRGKSPDQMLLSLAASPRLLFRDFADRAEHDMQVGHAESLNLRVRTVPSVYYFSLPCSATVQSVTGAHVPVPRLMEHMFFWSARQMGSLDAAPAWRENDGLVSTASAVAPQYAPQTPFDRHNVAPGVWNVLPVHRGDHLSLQGGVTVRTDPLAFYAEHLRLLASLARV